MDNASLTRRLAELGHASAALDTAAGAGVPTVEVGSAQQAADLLGTCTREGWKVRLQGAGTRGPVPEDADLVLSARALTGFDIYEPDDLTVGALAGTTHRAAAAQLAQHQQMLMLDSPGAAAATLGGSFASGQAGPLRAGYGMPRDLALGLTLVTGDGRLLRLGGQVVKNVAGYDLVRLVVGSRGTLGFIAQLHVRLRSLPQSDVTILADVPDAPTGAIRALELRDALGPVALELLTPARDSRSWRLALRLHGSAETNAAAAEKALRLLPGAVPLPADTATAFWAGLATAEAGSPIMFRFRALPSALPVLIAAAAYLTKSWSGNGFGDWAGAAHAADGVLRLWFSDSAALPLEPPAGLPAQLADILGTANGTCICERGPESMRSLFAAPEPTPRLLELERELRLRFDPGRILVGV